VITGAARQSFVGSRGLDATSSLDFGTVSQDTGNHLVARDLVA
jgi:hypothetical protein